MDLEALQLDDEDLAELTEGKSKEERANFTLVVNKKLKFRKDKLVVQKKQGG